MKFPETNPIEMLFCPIKKNIRLHDTKNITNIERSIDIYINNINSETLTKIFNKSFFG